MLGEGALCSHLSLHSISWYRESEARWLKTEIKWAAKWKDVPCPQDHWGNKVCLPGIAGSCGSPEQEFSAVAGDSPGLGCSDRQGGSLDGLGRCQVWVKNRRCDQEAVG